MRAIADGSPGRAVLQVWKGAGTENKLSIYIKLNITVFRGTLQYFWKTSKRITKLRKSGRASSFQR